VSPTSFGYGSLISESLRFAWKSKSHWIFGLFVGAGSGYGTTGKSKLRPYGPWFWLVGASPFPWIERHNHDLSMLPVILLMGFVGIVLALVFLGLRVVSEGGLIHACTRQAIGERATLRDSWNMGLRRFLYVLATLFLGAIALAAMAAVGIGFPALLWFTIHPAFGVLVGFVTVTFFIIFALFFFPFYAYSIRSAVIDAPGLVAAWQGAYELVRQQPARAVLVSLMRIVYKIVAFLVAMACLGVVGIILLPILALFWAIFPPLAVGVGLILGFPALLIVGGFLGSAESYFWTLAYLWTKHEAGGTGMPTQGPEVEAA